MSAKTYRLSAPTTVNLELTHDELMRISSAVGVLAEKVAHETGPGHGLRHSNLEATHHRLEAILNERWPS